MLWDILEHQFVKNFCIKTRKSANKKNMFLMLLGMGHMFLKPRCINGTVVLTGPKPQFLTSIYCCDSVH